MAIAGLLDAAEGQVNFSSDGRRIDIGYARFEVAHGAVSVVDVARVKSRRKAVLDRVGDVEGFVEAAAFDQADDRAENFFLRDAHGWLDSGEDRRREEGPIGISAFGERLAAAEKLRSFVLR